MAHLLQINIMIMTIFLIVCWNLHLLYVAVIHMVQFIILRVFVKLFSLCRSDISLKL
jgi:hypothetical protein